ncbi:MAG: Coenzyme F420 hydrogenase/dehydrogenase, beta subunit C-terminal domain [Paracoccaceae bacterium]|nr:Coenzyme F420 hydrogenase/dehydrogenase, beta subunit C-terminal domain [Paracoccaceae bacterium]
MSEVSDIQKIVTSGACIACGLCTGVSDDITMVRTSSGLERPKVARAPDMADINHACPALHIEGLSDGEASAPFHPVWGHLDHNFIGWAGDPAIRHQGSTGGVLSALAKFMLDTGKVDFILDVAPAPNAPARTTYRITESWSDAGGSRYGPAAPLAGRPEAEARAKRGQRFAFIGKPCDVSAIRLLAQKQVWLKDALAYRLTIMCGGASEFSKTADLLANWGVAEDELAEFRYRGYGNPGPTTATLKSGETLQTTYQALWEDETAWAIQHRCKICADAIGMAADIVSFDVWPDAGPVGEDDGFNGVITRTPKGTALVDEALATGALIHNRDIGPDDLESFQPHQSRKRRVVWARLAGQRAAGCIAPKTSNLGVKALAQETDWHVLMTQAKGTRDRLKAGRGTEEAP